jgi:pentatricopeptide repeat protein
LKKTKTPFLQVAKAHKQLETFFAVKPNTASLTREAPYIYETWPETFDASLFGRPRPIPRMITAEFDRQASLVNQLRMNYAAGMNENTDLADFLGSDYDTNPEGMSITLFFFTYSAVVGKEWQEFQKKQKLIELETAGQVETTREEFRDEHVPSGSAVVVEDPTSESNLLRDFTLGVCDGSACPNGLAAVDNAVIYVTSISPCPNLNTQAQAAYETLSSMVATLDPTQVFRTASLLDSDEALAEYEEVREVAAAQLDLAFDILKMTETRGLLPDPDVFKSLMEACGRCGDTKRALKLIEIMKRDKLVTDNDILLCFMASFAHYNASNDVQNIPFEENFVSGRRTSDAYSQFLKKKLIAMKENDAFANSLPVELFSDDDHDTSSASERLSDSGSEKSSFSASGTEHFSPSFLQLFSGPQTRTSTVTKKKRRRLRKKKPAVVTDRVRKQHVLGDSLLEFLYPDLRIDTFGDTCPMCSNAMSEEDVVTGWLPCEFQDFTTGCPQCRHRFVPRFKVSTSSPTFEGSQGPGTPLYCEFLSPWVLRKELGHIIVGGTNVDQILDPEFRSGRDVRATMWWNLIVIFKRYQLPFTFLLQGSFQNRLITPAPQD